MKNCVMNFFTVSNHIALSRIYQFYQPWQHLGDIYCYQYDAGCTR